MSPVKDTKVIILVILVVVLIIALVIAIPKMRGAGGPPPETAIEGGAPAAGTEATEATEAAPEGTTGEEVTAPEEGGG